MIMRRSPHLQALAATARIANIPSVVSNVWLGIALGSLANHDLASGHVWARTAALVVAGTCLYLAGNFANDWADREWDGVHRPERALPQGLFQPRLYSVVAVVCALLGVSVAAAVDCGCLLVALLIGVSIGTYTRWHKRSAWAVIPLGLCRAMLPVLGFFGALVPGPGGGGSVPGGLVAVLMVATSGLFLHIVGLSLSARREAFVGPRGRAMELAGWVFPVVGLAMWIAAYQGLRLPLGLSFVGVVPYALWVVVCLTVFRQPVPVHVSNLLAGIPLVDWIVLLPLALAGSAVGAPIAPVCLVLPPVAFVLGKGMQRLAAAT